MTVQNKIEKDSPFSESIRSRIISPLKAIRQHCIDCSGGSRAEVRNCSITDCSLHAFRFGYNPKRKGLGRIQNFYIPDDEPISNIGQVEIEENLPTQHRVSTKEKILEEETI
jgi:hypothetical protein